MNTHRVEVKTNHVMVIKYAAYSKNCRNLLAPVVPSSTNIVCFSDDGERCLQNVAVTLSRKSDIVAAVSVDL
jgi:hypothetical protein